jgi:hypothetical protein
LRTRKRIERGIGTETFTNRVRPDVTGNIFDGIVPPQNVIIEARLPKLALMALAIFVGGPLFENVDEFGEIAAAGSALGKEVKVVWHQAEAVEREEMFRSRGKQFGERPTARDRVGKYGTAIGATDRHEVSLAAEVVP